MTVHLQAADYDAPPPPELQPLLPVLLAELHRDRTALVRLADRCSALSEVELLTRELEDRLRRAVTLDDLRRDASRRGEAARAELESVLARITDPPLTDDDWSLEWPES